MERFEEFLAERKYLKNVTDKTLVYYRCAFKSWERHSQGDWKTWIVNQRQAGISATSINTYICAMNAHWKWAGTDLKVDYLKEEQKILATFKAEQVQRLLAFKPKGKNETRCHALVCLLLDTGLRIDESRKLEPANLDFENLLITVMGKGRKERRGPISFEGRKILYRFVQRHPGRFVFGTRNQTLCTVRNLQRDFAAICQRIGIAGVRCSFHTLRHTFAVCYLRNGGNLFYLSKILGHSSVKTTERYLQSLGVEDLQAVHERFSLLGRQR
ncbi:MAG TPA: site-specific integrase [Bryobacteraceae bacterium]|nr:site-specific integrase [Bryobacteraceae bacterium]